MRQFIRHPADIPIEIHSTEGNQARDVTDIGYGGLCFSSRQALHTGEVIRIRIDIIQPALELPARVVWSRKRNDGYEIGVEFTGEQDAYRARMVEQICHIEHFRQEVAQLEGRALSSREAALEWIERYAAGFPPWRS
jgi:predicted ATPase